MSWLQRQNQERNDYEDEDVFRYKRSWRTVICTDITKGWIFIVTFAVIIPVLVYFLVTNSSGTEGNGHYSCLVDPTYRVPCGKENISSADCSSISCCFDRDTKECYHFLPSKYFYTLNNKSKMYEAFQKTSPFDTASVDNLQLDINEKNENILSITLRESDGTTNVERNTVANKNYNIKLSQEKLMLEISRAKTNEVIFSTSRGPLIASDKYWEWTIYLEGTALFGLNQTVINVTQNVHFSKVLYKNSDDHYSLPVIWAYHNGSFHGIKLKHEGPLEIRILPSRLIILRSLFGDNIEIELALGPTPALLHDQQASPFVMPPLWALGTHMCRRSNNLNLAQMIKQFKIVDSSRSFCIDDNLFMAIMKDNLTNPDILANFSSIYELQDKKFLLSLPPQILVNTSLHKAAEELDILYKENETSYIGKYLNEEVVYPDYHHDNIQEYMSKFYDLLNEYFLNITIDGLVLDDNWPVDNSFKMNGSDFPYFSQTFADAMSYTIPWNLTNPSSPSTEQMDTHNSYGSWQLNAIEEFYTSSNIDEPFIMSSTKSFGQSEPLLLQNIGASWDNLNMQLQNILFNSIVGNHLVSLPVCGDTQNYNAKIHETLCIRWYLIAATLPMFRVSSLSPWREPANLYTKFALQNANMALKRREMLLPIYETILSKNLPVLRPMFYDFYEDNVTFSLNKQYMIGENILMVHPLTPSASKLQVYLPSKINIWYELWAGKMFNTTSDPWVNVTVVENDFIVFITQGTVVPLKDGTTINIIVGLECTVLPCEASTNLLLDSNMLQFSADEVSLIISNITNSCDYKVGYIQVYKYDNGTEYATTYSNKNVDVCNEQGTVKIYYVDNSDA